MRFHDDPFATTLRTPALACTPEGERYAVLLADTVLYPESGGQPDDHGTLNDQPVQGLRRVAEGVIHLVAAPVSGEVEVRLDWSRRFDHMQQHSGQHLLSAIAHDQFGLPTTAFHLGPERCDIEVDGELDPQRRDALEAQVNTVIREARPLQTRIVAPSSLANLPVRTRGLPEGFDGLVRLVEIEGIDLNTCGGTHVQHTGQLQALKIIAVERLKRATRVHFLVGGRVLSQLDAALGREQTLTRLLNGPPETHAAAVERLLEADKRNAKALRSLNLELAQAIGQTLSPVGDPPTVRYHRPDGDPSFLAAVADAVRARHPESLCVLFAGVREGVFLLAGPEALVAQQGPAIAARVEGRGGGTKGKYQGKAARIDLWDT